MRTATIIQRLRDVEWLENTEGTGTLLRGAVSALATRDQIGILKYF
jgi:hypothetical protein